MLTRHAGCPVLVGSKWGKYCFAVNIATQYNLFNAVCNKWIHEGGQEFRRRCGLTPNEEPVGHTL